MKTEAGENRYVPIHPKIKEYIEYYYNRTTADELYSPHCTRHTFITNAKSAKIDEYALKVIVGHEIGDVTEEIYTTSG